MSGNEKVKENQEFESFLVEEVRKSILRQIRDVRFIDYHHQNKKCVPSDIVDQAWKSVDWDIVISNINKQIQDTICNVVVQSMLTEIKTDVKSILSVDGVRQKIKMNAYPEIMKCLEGVDLS